MEEREEKNQKNCYAPIKEGAIKMHISVHGSFSREYTIFLPIGGAQESACLFSAKALNVVQGDTAP